MISVPPLEIVAGSAVPPEWMARVPPDCTAAPMSRPRTISLPASVVPLSIPPWLIVKKPPELTVVESAVPPESTNIEPPLMTTSPVSVCPEETL